MAPNVCDQIEALKMKLKSATKAKIYAERNMFQARNKERALNEQFAIVKAELEFAKEQLEYLKNQISQTKHKLSLTEIFYVSEKTKADAHVTVLEQHKKGFEHLFDKERDLFEMRMKEMQDKEAEEEEEQRLRAKEIAKRNEREVREAAAVEAECAALEQECAVLKKRNHAIMLKLRRRLLETENARRELAKRNT